MAPLDPPPEAIYDSPEVAEAHIQQWAEAHGYATVRKNHSKDKFSEVRKIWVICDKGGKIRRIEPTDHNHNKIMRTEIAEMIIRSGGQSPRRLERLDHERPGVNSNLQLLGLPTGSGLLKY